MGTAWGRQGRQWLLVTLANLQRCCAAVLLLALGQRHSAAPLHSTNPAPSCPALPLQNLKGKAHFTSLHGKVGLVAFSLAMAAPLLGVLSFRRLGLIQRFPEPWQPRLKWLHRLVGGVAWRGAGGRRSRGVQAVLKAQHACSGCAGRPGPRPCSRPSLPLPAVWRRQVSAYAYVLSLVTMLLALPHTAVLTGVWSTTWQVRGRPGGGAARAQAPPVAPTSATAAA